MAKTPTSQRRAPSRGGSARPRRRRRKRRIRWPRVFAALAVVAAPFVLWTLAARSCSAAGPDSAAAPESAPAAPAPGTEAPAPESAATADGTDGHDSRLARLRELLAPADTVAPPEPPAAPDAGCVPLRSRFNAPFGRTFNDSNHVHLGAAVLSGILPVTDIRSAWHHGRGLVGLRSCPDFYIDRLSHSYPYLSHDGAALLHDIGRRFNDSLAARGGGAYRIKVTSLLRTDRTVGRLRRVNRNATARSAHRYGATFDISYSKFICDDSTATPRRSFEDLKRLLAEVIDDLRREGRCYVKHERRQACFHITARADEKSEARQTEPHFTEPKDIK